MPQLELNADELDVLAQLASSQASKLRYRPADMFGYGTCYYDKATTSVAKKLERLRAAEWKRKRALWDKARRSRAKKKK